MVSDIHLHMGSLLTSSNAMALATLLAVSNQEGGFLKKSHLRELGTNKAGRKKGKSMGLTLLNLPQ